MCGHWDIPIFRDFSDFGKDAFSFSRFERYLANLTKLHKLPFTWRHLDRLSRRKRNYNIPHTFYCACRDNGLDYIVSNDYKVCVVNFCEFTYRIDFGNGILSVNEITLWEDMNPPKSFTSHEVDVYELFNVLFPISKIREYKLSLLIE
jgi:hypothetical protein